MLHVYHLRSLQACFQDSKFENIAGFLVQDQFRSLDRLVELILPHLLLQCFLESPDVAMVILDKIYQQGILITHHAQQQVFWSYRPAG